MLCSLIVSAVCIIYEDLISNNITWRFMSRSNRGHASTFFRKAKTMFTLIERRRNLFNLIFILYYVELHGFFYKSVKYAWVLTRFGRRKLNCNLLINYKVHYLFSIFWCRSQTPTILFFILSLLFLDSSNHFYYYRHYTYNY